MSMRICNCPSSIQSHGERPWQRLLAFGWLSTATCRPGAGATVGLDVSALDGVLQDTSIGELLDDHVLILTDIVLSGV